MARAMAGKRYYTLAASLPRLVHFERADKVRGQIEHELPLIDELKYAAYFLTVHDLVAFARETSALDSVLVDFLDARLDVCRQAAHDRPGLLGAQCIAVARGARRRRTP